MRKPYASQVLSRSLLSTGMQEGLVVASSNRFYCRLSLMMNCMFGIVMEGIQAIEWHCNKTIIPICLFMQIRFLSASIQTYMKNKNKTDAGHGLILTIGNIQARINSLKRLNPSYF